MVHDDGIVSKVLPPTQNTEAYNAPIIYVPIQPRTATFAIGTLQMVVTEDLAHTPSNAAKHVKIATAAVMSLLRMNVMPVTPAEEPAPTPRPRPRPQYVRTLTSPI